MTETRCGYQLADVRKSLILAIEHRDKATAQRWAAELVATPAAFGSLWASYWISWAEAQSGPAIPIILRQSWGEMTDSIYALEGDWVKIRNDAEVRRQVCALTIRMIDQPRPSPAYWPSKDLVQRDVALVRSSEEAAAIFDNVVRGVWQNIDDSMELRFLAGRFLHSIEAGDMRVCLSLLTWSFWTPAQQGLPLPLKIAERGPPSLPAKIRSSPLWFWLELGGAWITHRGTAIHPGWRTMHTAVVSAFRDHYKRWTPGNRMSMLLAWTILLRQSCVDSGPDIWIPKIVPALSLAEIDRPYREIAEELANPDTVKRAAFKAAHEESSKTSSERKLEESDALIMATLGLT